MTATSIFSATGILLFFLGLYFLIQHSRLIMKFISIAVMGNGVFLTLIAGGYDTNDVIRHAMVLTGIVVSVSATGLGLALARKISKINTGN